MGPVETMSVETCVATGQLHPVAALSPSERFGRFDQLRANTVAAKVTAHVHALELTAPPAGVLKVRKDDDLTDTHHVAVHFRHQHLASAPAVLFNRSPVRVDVLFVLRFRRKGPSLHDQRRGTDVAKGDGANQDLHALGTRVDGREDAHALFDGFGGVETDVLSKEITNHLHARRQTVRDAGRHAGGR